MSFVRVLAEILQTPPQPVVPVSADLLPPGGRFVGNVEPEVLSLIQAKERRSKLLEEKEAEFKTVSDNAKLYPDDPQWKEKLQILGSDIRCLRQETDILWRLVTMEVEERFKPSDGEERILLITGQVGIRPDRASRFLQPFVFVGTSDNPDAPEPSHEKGDRDGSGREPPGSRSV